MVDVVQTPDAIADRILRQLKIEPNRSIGPDQ